VRILPAAFLFLFATVSLLAAPASKIDRELAEFETRITKELQQTAPAAVPVFQLATRERDAERFKEAAQHFAEVIRLAPSFSHAYRRQAHCELALGKREEALTLQRKALQLLASRENYAFLAAAIVEKEGDLTESERSEAASAAESALKEGHRDVTVLVQVGQVALRLENIELLDRVSSRLVQLADDEAISHYLRAWALGMRGELWDGRRELKRAKELGLPAEAFDALSDAFDAARPWYQKVAIWTAWVVIPWGAGLLLLYGAGAYLSRLALRASSELPADQNGVSSSFGHLLRKSYAVVINLASAYYYLSVPVVAAVTLGVAAVVILGLLAAGWLPIKLIIIAVVVGGVSVIGLVRGMFVKFSDDDPGVRLELEEHPEFRQVLHDVASRIGTRPVDNVYLTPGTDIAVMERRRRGSEPERCLILGAGILDGFELQSFKAVLGHEYGHLTNRDTAGGAVAIAVRSRLEKTAMHVAEGGAAAWYNPAWLFLRGFHALFLKISHGASRFQEAMADRWAAFAYGSHNFEAGLLHAVVRSIEFDAQASSTIKQVVDNQKPLMNLYASMPSVAEDSDVRTAVDEHLASETSPYDSHPSFRDRIAWVRALHAPGEESGGAPREVWTLFNDREGLQRRMTEVVRANVKANYGVDIAATTAVEEVA
jgi:Zn-dependent protease with chaperone function